MRRGGLRPHGHEHINGLYQAGKSAAQASALLRAGNMPDAVAQARIAYRFLAGFLIEHGDEEDPCD